MQVILKCGPYGYYVQLGEDKKGHLPKRANAAHVCWSFSGAMCAPVMSWLIYIACLFWLRNLFQPYFPDKGCKLYDTWRCSRAITLSSDTGMTDLKVKSYCGSGAFLKTFWSADDLVYWFLTREPTLKMGSLWPWSLVNLDLRFDIAAQWLLFQRYSYVLSYDVFWNS